MSTHEWTMLGMTLLTAVGGVIYAKISEWRVSKHLEKEDREKRNV